ncbi:DUF4185 domain-containing protein [Parapedobacter tibetensis]|uniref:DUF4185 domain-containing protein n=1 Tax=Parapedobacter tibetensis TaxID=2972951 RepID=UPI00214D888A|nr:DUF4185 domain-containing protein [Parapedobacter tibetensis]
MNHTKKILTLFTVLLTSWTFAQEIPYPESQVISGIEIDWSTHQRHAKGSDNFQLTWADDGHQYGIWGDGGGFAGSDGRYRVSFGVARIEGDYDNYKGYDRYGHKESAEYEAKIKGKSWGLVCVGGNLYAWIHPDREEGWGGWAQHHSESKLYVSKDKGASWKATDWVFSPEENLTGGGILQFGKNGAGASDKFVYHYFVHPDILLDPDKGESELMLPGKIYLSRVHRDRLMKRKTYEFFGGFSGDKPIWVKNVDDKKPIFEDSNGVGTPMGISYNPGLERYLLCTGHSKGHSGLLGVFEAPAPWGPWSTVTYATNETWFGHDYDPSIMPRTTFFWCVPTKWMSEDGRSATLVFTGGWESGGVYNDSFNTVRVRFAKP